MRDEHPDTVSATKSDKFIKSSVENLVPIPSEPEGESECDVPTREEFTTFSNILFDADYESESSDDQSFFDEDVPEKIFSNPLFDEEIIPMKMDQHHYNAESYLMESLRTHDSSLIILYKIDSLLDEDILILKDLPSNDTLLLPEIESFHFDIPSFSRPPAKPPDGNTRILNIKMMGDISDQKVPMPKLMITLASNQEKSPDLLSHQGLQAFLHSATCSMMIHGKNIPLLDVPLFHFYPLDQLKYGGIWSSSVT
nr:hypothetical protein [Tanacetum cinerariifolium]